MGLTATPGRHTIDIGDIKQFGKDGVFTSQGALGHEIKEGFEMQADHINPNTAHGLAVGSENKINGTTSLGAEFSIYNSARIDVSVSQSGIRRTGELKISRIGAFYKGKYRLRVHLLKTPMNDPAIVPREYAVSRWFYFQVVKDMDYHEIY